MTTPEALCALGADLSAARDLDRRQLLVVALALVDLVADGTDRLSATDDGNALFQAAMSARACLNRLVTESNP